MDDELIGAIVASLRIIQAPDDPLPVEAFAEQVLPPALVNRVRASHRGLDLTTALRSSPAPCAATRMPGSRGASSFTSRTWPG